MPQWELSPYVEMMERIQAGESLTRMSDVSAGSGVMEESDQRSYRRGLVRSAHGGRLPKEKASVASLQQMGIVVVTRD